MDISRVLNLNLNWYGAGDSATNVYAEVHQWEVHGVQGVKWKV